MLSWKRNNIFTEFSYTKDILYTVKSFTRQGLQLLVEVQPSANIFS